MIKSVLQYLTRRCATFIKLILTVHLDIIYGCYMVICVLTYILRLSDHGLKEMVKSTLQYVGVLHSPYLLLTLTVHLNIIYKCNMVACISP